MSKIVFFCIPAYGHTNPTLGVVRELTARGHEVRYYSYEPMRTLIEAAGAQFVACDPYDCEQHLTPADGARVGKDIAFSTHILVETTLALDEMVCAGMRAYAPDCIVADSMAVWGKAVAKKLGIPFISSTTTFAFNRYSAKVMKQSGGQMLKMLLAMPKINRDLQRLRDRGYPIKNILDIIQNDDRTDTIVYTSPEFQRQQQRIIPGRKHEHLPVRLRQNPAASRKIQRRNRAAPRLRQRRQFTDQVTQHTADRQVFGHRGFVLRLMQIGAQRRKNLVAVRLQKIEHMPQHLTAARHGIAAAAPEKFAIRLDRGQDRRLAAAVPFFPHER